MLFAPFPLFGQAQAEPPPPGPTPIATANREFRNGILPVMCGLFVNLILPNQQLEEDESGIDSRTIFNFNNPVFFLGMDTTKTVALDIDCKTDAALSGNPDTPFPENAIPAGTVALALNTLRRKGQTVKSGVTDYYNESTYTEPQGPLKHFLLLTRIYNRDDATEMASGSSLNVIRFVEQKSLIEITE
jgi:hypothetical protein